MQDRKIHCLQARPCIFQPGGNFDMPGAVQGLIMADGGHRYRRSDDAVARHDLPSGAPSHFRPPSLQRTGALQSLQGACMLHGPGLHPYPPRSVAPYTRGPGWMGVGGVGGGCFPTCLPVVGSCLRFSGFCKGSLPARMHGCLLYTSPSPRDFG